MSDRQTSTVDSKKVGIWAWNDLCWFSFFSDSNFLASSEILCKVTKALDPRAWQWVRSLPYELLSVFAVNQKDTDQSTVIRYILQLFEMEPYDHASSDVPAILDIDRDGSSREPWCCVYGNHRMYVRIIP